ncbi:hypothetical protein [Desulfotomaculum copahuensis]|nr:hypothetical protein [Desulfotomaculum copahuensis]
MKKIIFWVLTSLLLQGGIYLYLDQYLLTPTSPFQVKVADNQPDTTTSGQVYYSRDKKYMAQVTADKIEMYAMPARKLMRTVNLGDKHVSYFRWLDDRDLALAGMYTDVAGAREVELTRLNPLTSGYEVSATIKDLPARSQIVNVAYSTATNVVYMQVTRDNISRIYRFDANHYLSRIWLNTYNIGRIATLVDQDCLIYDDLNRNTVNIREANGSQRIISPPAARYRLIGADRQNNIYIAKLNREGLGESIYAGRLLVGFRLTKDLNTPVSTSELKLSDVIG